MVNKKVQAPAHAPAYSGAVSAVVTAALKPAPPRRPAFDFTGSSERGSRRAIAPPAPWPPEPAPSVAGLGVVLRRSWNETLRGQISDMPAIAFLPKIFLPPAHVLDDVAQVFDGVIQQGNAVVGRLGADRGRRKRTARVLVTIARGLDGPVKRPPGAGLLRRRFGGRKRGIGASTIAAPGLHWICRRGEAARRHVRVLPRSSCGGRPNFHRGTRTHRHLNSTCPPRRAFSCSEAPA